MQIEIKLIKAKKPYHNTRSLKDSKTSKKLPPKGYTKIVSNIPNTKYWSSKKTMQSLIKMVSKFFSIMLNRDDTENEITERHYSQKKPEPL